MHCGHMFCWFQFFILLKVTYKLKTLLGKRGMGIMLIIYIQIFDF